MKPKKYELEREMRKRGGRYVESLRLAHDPKITQRELAEKLGLPYYTFISQVEVGASRIPPDKMASWAEALGVDLQEFESKYMPFESKYIPLDNVVPINFSNVTKGADNNSGGSVLEDAYQPLMREALQGVVRKIINLVSMMERHPEMDTGVNTLYIMFNPQHPKTKLPANLIEQYPDQLSIVLGNRWHSLIVDDDCFHVTLSFDGVETPISVPWESILCFADETAQFGLNMGDKLFSDTFAEDGPEEFKDSNIVPLFPSSDNDC